MTGFRSAITSADGSTAEGTCTEAEALRLLATAVRRGYRAEATRQGGAVIVRDVMLAGWHAPRQHTVTLEPARPAGMLTATVRRDLDAIARRAGSSFVSGRIHAGFCSIPPGAAARLVSRGLMTVAGTSVSVSLTARLAMLAQDHRTRTGEPRGYCWPSDIGFAGHAGRNRGGGRGGKMHDRTSAGSCSCGGWSAWGEDRTDARRQAHEHRQHVTAELVRLLS